MLTIAQHCLFLWLSLSLLFLSQSDSHSPGTARWGPFVKALALLPPSHEYGHLVLTWVNHYSPYCLSEFLSWSHWLWILLFVLYTLFFFWQPLPVMKTIRPIEKTPFVNSKIVFWSAPLLVLKHGSSPMTQLCASYVSPGAGHTNALWQPWSFWREAHKTSALGWLAFKEDGTF